MGCGASKTDAASPTVSFYETFTKAFDSKDLDTVASLYAEDCKWVWHSSGKEMDKAAFVGMMTNFLAKMPPTQKQRLVYENADICVSHGFNRFPDGSVEATMMVQKLKNGKAYLIETGSTLIKEDSPNYIPAAE